MVDTASDSTLLRDLGQHPGTPGRVGEHETKVVNKIWLTVSPLSPQINPVVISLVPDYIIGIDKTGRRHQPTLGPQSKSYRHAKGQAEATDITITPNLDIKNIITRGGW